MAVNVERDPMALAVEDDPMRAPARLHNGQRPVAAIADPAPLGIATAAAGLYAAFAALINSTYERTLLPLRAVRHGR
jgi:succinate-acetate transporter protein